MASSWDTIAVPRSPRFEDVLVNGKAWSLHMMAKVLRRTRKCVAVLTERSSIAVCSDEKEMRRQRGM
jgi:hypothetical protein